MRRFFGGCRMSYPTRWRKLSRCRSRFCLDKMVLEIIVCLIKKHRPTINDHHWCLPPETSWYIYIYNIIYRTWLIYPAAIEHIQNGHIERRHILETIISGIYVKFPGFNSPCRRIASTKPIFERSPSCFRRTCEKASSWEMRRSCVH